MLEEREGGRGGTTTHLEGERRWVGVEREECFYRQCQNLKKQRFRASHFSTRSESRTEIEVNKFT